MVVVICDECKHEYRIFMNEYSKVVCSQCNSINKTLKKYL